MASTINKIELEGRVYKYETRQTSTGKMMYCFGLQFWNGKDKEGKSVYTFINCKCFDDFKLKEKQDIVVSGSYTYNSWTDKEGKVHERPEILVRKIQPKGFKSENKEQEAEFINDSLPF